MLDVKSKPVLLELSLDILSRRTVFTVYRCLYYHPGSSLVCGFRDFHVNVAIAWVHAGIFKERMRYVDQLKFTTTARLINRKGDRVLRPSQNSCHVNFLRDATRQRDMLSSVAIVHGVWLEGYAAADVSGDRADPPLHYFDIQIPKIQVALPEINALFGSHVEYTLPST